MPQALTPVNIAGTEFDALITLDETAEADVPEYPIETGYTVSDTIIRKSKLLAMSLFVSGMPVTWRGRLGGGSSRIASVKKQLLQLYADGNPITVNTSDNTYENMAFTSISFHKATDIGFALQIDVEMKEVIVTSTATTTIPDSYGKAEQQAHQLAAPVRQHLMGVPERQAEVPERQAEVPDLALEVETGMEKVFCTEL